MCHNLFKLTKYTSNYIADHKKEFKYEKYAKILKKITIKHLMRLVYSLYFSL